MTITITDNHTRHGSETVTLRYGRLVKNSRAFACVYEYTNGRREKKVSFRSGLFREKSEYAVVFLAVKSADAYIRSVDGGDARLVDRAWRQYLDTKQIKRSRITDETCIWEIDV
ncbi:MAG: hypothetical protein IJR39_04415 [Treponema sp.]|nr:hypothetical protein [Treponema sp.]